MVFQSHTSYIYISFLMTDILDPFYLESLKALQVSPKKGTSESPLIKDYSSFSKKLTRQQYYIYICIYMLSDTQLLMSYLEKTYREDSGNAITFLKSLWAVYLIYKENSKKSQFLESIYEIILTHSQLRELAINKNLLPYPIKAFQKQTLLVGARKKLLEIRYISKNQINNFEEDINGCARLSLILTKLYQNQPNQDTIWEELLQCFGAFQISSEKLIFSIINATISIKKFKQCINFLKRIQQLLGIQTLLNILIPFPQLTSQEDPELIFRGKLNQLMEDYSQSLQPITYNITVLALLAKEKAIDECLIFSKLTPSIEMFGKILKKRYEHEKILLWRESINTTYDFEEINNKVWGQHLYNDKLLFLKNLILQNSFDKFKKIHKQFKLQLYSIYDPGLIFVFSQLYEWYIDKIYQKSCNFIKHFKVTSSKNIRNFPQGYFKQSYIVDPPFIKAINEILSYMGHYVFSRRSTFIKTCRVCKFIVKSEMFIKQGLDNISKIIRDYLLPSLQYYKQDPSVLFALEDLLNNFDFRKQQSIFLQSTKKRYTLPLQLMANDVEILQQNNKLLNRISQNSDMKVYKRLKNLLICNSLTCMQEIVSRVPKFKIGQNEIIEKVIVGSSNLSKKVMVMYLLLDLSENQEILIQSNSKPDSSFESITNFINYLLLVDPFQDAVSLILEYFIAKLAFKDNSSIELTNFQYFHGEVYFLTSLFMKAFPIFNKMSVISNGNEEQASAGFYLQAKKYNLENSMIQSQSLRKSLMLILFNTEQVIQCNFYKIVTHLSYHFRKVIQDRNYNFRIAAKIQDEALFLMMLMIQLVHFEIKDISAASKYFSFHLFYQLLNIYGVPFEIVFMILRKSIFIESNKWKKQNWIMIKTLIVKTFSKNTLTKSVSTKDLYQPLGLNVSSRTKMLKFIGLDLFEIFWICDIESLFFRKNTYLKHVKTNTQINLCSLTESKMKEKDIFELDLVREMSTYEVRHTVLWQKQKLQNQDPRLMSKTINSFFKMETEHQLEYLDLFLKYCIIRRSLLSEREAYYSWLFLLEVLKENQLPALTFMKIICRLNYSLAIMLHFSTQREAEGPISMLANFSSELMKYDLTRNQLQNKLIKYYGNLKLVTTAEYNDIQEQLFSCHSNIIEKLMQSDDQVYSVKNNLFYLNNVQFIPFAKQHISLLKDYISKITYKHAELNSDIEDLVKSVLKELNQREKQLKIYKTKTVKEETNDPDSMDFSESQKSQNLSLQRPLTKSEDYQSTSQSEEGSIFDKEDFMNLSLPIIEEEQPVQINKKEEEEVYLDFIHSSKKKKNKPRQQLSLTIPQQRPK